MSEVTRRIIDSRMGIDITEECKYSSGSMNQAGRDLRPNTF